MDNPGRRPSLAEEASSARVLLEAYAAEVAGDDEAVQDLLEGETSLVEAAGRVVRRLRETEGLLAGLKPIAEDLKERKGRFEKRRERLRGMLAKAMVTAGIDKLALAEATLSAKATEPKVRIEDRAAIPSQLLRPVKGFEALVQALLYMRLALVMADPEASDALARALWASPAMEPDEGTILQALLQGEDVPGASLAERGVTITVRTK